MARRPTKAEAEAAEAEGGADLVEVECIIDNIHTSKGKIVFEETIMLDASEAEFINKQMRKILKQMMSPKAQMAAAPPAEDDAD